MGSQTSWDESNKTAVLCLAMPVPLEEDLAAIVAGLPRVCSVDLDGARQVLTVITCSRQDCNVVENLLRERGYLESARWQQDPGTLP